jgi:cytochrome c556
MQEADRAGFTAEAHTLRDQANRLRDAARQQRLPQMRRDLDSIHATCLSCHNRYRDFSGQLNTTQTSLPLD